MPFILPPLNIAILEESRPQIEDLEGDAVWSVDLNNLEDLFATSAPRGRQMGTITFTATVIFDHKENINPETIKS